MRLGLELTPPPPAAILEAPSRTFSWGSHLQMSPPWDVGGEKRPEQYS